MVLPLEPLGYSVVGIYISMHLMSCQRIRVVRRADGYYAQFCINVERTEESIPTGKAIGIDVGLNHFYTDSDGDTVPNPRHLRKSEKALKQLQKRVSRKKKGSSNRKKAINKLGRKHLKVSRQPIRLRSG